MAELPSPLDLSGPWRAAVADEGLRRAFAATDLDDDEWETLDVPGHWRSTAAFGASDGPVLYRRRYEAPAPEEGQRAWLVLDGLFYQGDIWLDGAYLGDTEGYFVRHTFEITEPSRDRSEHVVAVEATCAPQDDRTAKRNITGAFQHSASFDPDWNPGGIWRPVRLEHTGPVRARSLRVLCREATPERATVALRAELDSDGARTVCLRTRVAGVEDVVERPLALGSNFVEWTVTVTDPDLWWPAALGDQPLHELDVEVEVDGTCSHAVSRRIGLRSLSFKKWVLRVNGERLFLKGSNLGPTRMALAEATSEELRADVTRAREVGLDLLRLHAHVSRPELYEAADEAGLLLWQDFPLQWGYSRGIRKQASRQAAAMVDLLGHHPSVAIWCGHNEPLALDVEPGRDPTRLTARYAAGQQLPTWNKSVLDRSVKRALERNDGSRPVVTHSGVFPHPGSSGTDTHLYFGWYHGDERDFPAFLRAWPKTARFVTEFGAQAVPAEAGFMEPDRWPDLDWEHLERRHALQKAIFDVRVPPAEFDSFDAWRDATQRYQATVIKHHVETLRRLKYVPTGGFCQFSFADASPAVTWSVLDHERAPKAGFDALREACRAVIVVAERLPATVAPGDTLALDIHVVSDLREGLAGCEVRARVSWADGAHERRWKGDLAPDACERVGTVPLVVPETTGSLVLELTLTASAVTATNRYETQVVPVA